MAESKVTCRIPDGKGTYVLGYRHPVIKDVNGSGKKIQRGTGTSDEAKAKELAGQLSELINDEKWHFKGMKSEAMNRFDRIVVDAFYDCMPDAVESNKVLEVIPMKTLEEGYLNEALIGSNGAGKTTLLRKLIGTTQDVFPTTSSNRTTTCDMEIIRSDIKEYRLAVQFISRNELEADLMDNIYNAVSYVYSTRKVGGLIDDIELLTSIFNHREMSTRLTYTLGLYSRDAEDEDEDEEDEVTINGDIKEDYSFPEYYIDEAEKDEWLRSIEERLIAIADKYSAEEPDPEKIESKIQDDEEVLNLIEDIILEVIKKIDMIKNGKRIPAKSVWPDGWYYETGDREDFIKTAKMFVSNYYKAWGKLLTPIVRAMRMEGPFVEEGKDKVEPMVITDGIGLGHSTNSTSIPASVLRRCESADVIIFVDSSSTPMLENTKEALKSLIEFGYADRIIFAYTKMDLVEGGNYRNIADKKRHVLLTLQNYLAFLRKQENTVLSETEMQSIISNCVFFSALNKEEISKLTAKGLNQMDIAAKAVTNKHISADAVHFEYDALKLYFYIKEATLGFRTTWAERTGYSAVTNRTEHWSRIKALSRRLGVLGQENYCELQPLADFSAYIQEKINIFINQPGNIIPEFTREEVTDALKQTIKRAIGREFKELNRRRMWTDTRPLEDWRNAYRITGTGSRDARARAIEGIFDQAAPNLADIPNLTQEQNKYLSEVIALVETVLNENGCRLMKFNY